MFSPSLLEKLKESTESVTKHLDAEKGDLLIYYKTQSYMIFHILVLPILPAPSFTCSQGCTYFDNLISQQCYFVKQNLTICRGVNHSNMHSRSNSQMNNPSCVLTTSCCAHCNKCMGCDHLIFLNLTVVAIS